MSNNSNSNEDNNPIVNPRVPPTENPPPTVVTKVPIFIYIVLFSLVSYLFYSEYLHRTQTKIFATGHVGENITETPTVNNVSGIVPRRRDVAAVQYKNAKVNELECPVYKSPITLPLPELPREKLQNAKTKDEVILVLYDSIRDLQLYTEIHRQSLYDDYEAYILSCK